VKFLEPLWLVVLVIPPVTAFLLWRIRGSNAVRFTGTEFLEDLRVGGRRSAAAGFLATIAASLLLLPLAEPRLDRVGEEERATVVLALDVSGSMSATDVAPSRLQVAKDSASSFVTSLPKEWRVALVAFSERAFMVTAPTQDRQSLLTALNGLAAQGGTSTGDALDLALDVGRAGSSERVAIAIREKDALNDPAATVIVLLSDGAQTSGLIDHSVAAQRASRLGVPVHTIALGTTEGTIDILYPDGQVRPLEVPPDFQTSARIAQATGGEFFTAITGRELQKVYDSVTASIERERELTDMSSWLIGGAAILGAAAFLVNGGIVVRRGRRIGHGGGLESR
jgi:Ca-activated chloride channel family protein